MKVAIELERKNGDGNGGDLDGLFAHEQYCYKIEMFMFAWLAEKHWKLLSNLSLKIPTATAETITT